MKIEDAKAGLKVKWEEDGILKDTGTISDRECSYGADGVWVAWDSDGGEYWLSASRLEPVEQPFSLANTKINVQKYANDNGLTLEHAHKEVQEWLFEQGYKWGLSGRIAFSTADVFLFTDSFIAGDLTLGNEEDHFENHRNKEITLQRTVAVTLTPSFVEASVEYVELGGRKYVKKELEEALSKIKAVEEV